MLGTLGATIGLTNLFGSNTFNSTAQWGLKPGDLMGGNFGHSLNLWSGQTDSANLQYKHNLALQHDAQNFAKWQMANAHQEEMKDLDAAGLNPVLAANGGASAGGVAANSTGPGAGGIDPIGIIGTIVNMMNNTKATNAIINKTEAEADNIRTNTEKTRQVIEWTPALNTALIRMQNATGTKQHASAQKDFQDIIESQVNTKAQEIMNSLSSMDLQKRRSQFDNELEIYKKQMLNELINQGMDSSIVMKTLDRVFGTVGKVFHASAGLNYNHSSSNVNIKSNGPKIYTHTATTPEIPVIY